MYKRNWLGWGLPHSPASFLLGWEDGTSASRVRMCSDSGNKTKMDGDMLNENGSKQEAICTDNNLLWGGKAYSFGDFVRYLSGHASHVKNTGCPFPNDGLTALTARNVDFHNCLVIWREKGSLSRHFKSHTLLWRPCSPSSRWAHCGADSSSACLAPTLSHLTRLSSSAPGHELWLFVTFNQSTRGNKQALTLLNMLKPSKDKINANPSIHT